MTRRTGIGKVFARAALGPLNLVILGGAVVIAIALASWPIGALGGAAYAALVASDIASPEFRRRVLFGRTRPLALPDGKAIRDPELRAAVDRITAARANLAEVERAIPERIQRNVTAARTSIDELIGHAAALASRADQLSRHLARLDPAMVSREAEALAARATNTQDAQARASYQAAAQAAHERVATLRELTTMRERALAHLAQIESAIKGVPTRLVRLRALDDQASDALAGDLGDELSRMTIDLQAFEQTLEAIAEVS